MSIIQSRIGFCSCVGVFFSPCQPKIFHGISSTGDKSLGLQLYFLTFQPALQVPALVNVLDYPVHDSYITLPWRRGGFAVARCRLIIAGQRGPQEVVSRHPENWGWILFSQGSLWTSFEMPFLDDESGVLLDGNLKDLPCRLNLAQHA